MIHFSPLGYFHAYDTLVMNGFLPIAGTLSDNGFLIIDDTLLHEWVTPT